MCTLYGGCTWGTVWCAECQRLGLSTRVRLPPSWTNTQSAKPSYTKAKTRPNPCSASSPASPATTPAKVAARPQYPAIQGDPLHAIKPFRPTQVRPAKISSDTPLRLPAWHARAIAAVSFPRPPPPSARRRNPLFAFPPCASLHALRPCANHGWLRPWAPP